ncbi:MAG TPA: hypothetical protein VMM13_04495, partial [Euzebya sp.]|nr:hypothetical protein [Euzebya sp.]
MSSRIALLLLAALVVVGATRPLLSAAQGSAHGELDLSALPLGDGRLSHGPEEGSLWSCTEDFGGGGAFRDGEWIDEASGTWSLVDKTVEVDGANSFDGDLSIT